MLVLALTLSQATAAMFTPVVQSTAINTDQIKAITYSCPAGWMALSGGAQITGIPAGVTITASRPGTNPLGDQWSTEAIAIGPTAGAWGLTENIVCANPAIAATIQWVTVTQDVVPGDTWVTATATCPAGTSVISGGAGTWGPLGTVSLVASGPTVDGWYATATTQAFTQAGIVTEVACIPTRLWRQRFTTTSQLVREVNGGATAAATCPAGSYALSGGAMVVGAIDAVGLTMTAPLGTPPVAWAASATARPGYLPGWELRADAICLRP